MPYKRLNGHFVASIPQSVTNCYSGSDDGRHFAGVGFAIKKRILESVITFGPISERMSPIIIKGKFKNLR